MGTPQARWREMHHSERSDSMAVSRARLAASGSICTALVASIAGAHSSDTLANHCCVVRTIIGLFVRQSYLHTYVNYKNANSKMICAYG